jgi:branched-chain amino acid transport system permease protein
MKSTFEAIPGVKQSSALRLQRFAPMCQMTATLIVIIIVLAYLSNGFWVSTLTSAFAIAIASSGIGVLYGRLGLVSLCQYALVGVGGWAALRLQFAFHMPFEFCALGGGVAAMIVGGLWGLPALRMRGLYLALVTLMLAGAFQIVISAAGFPDGGGGFLGRVTDTGRVMMERPGVASGDTSYFIYVACTFILASIFVELHTTAKPGRSWALIRRDERMAEAAGVNIVFYKLWAFALAGFLAGLAGALLAGSVGQLDGRAFDANQSILLFVLSVIGGVTGWLGALMTGVLARAVPAGLNYFGVNGFVAMIIFGIALIHAFATSAEGLAGQIVSSISRVRARFPGVRRD